MTVSRLLVCLWFVNQQLVIIIGFCNKNNHYDHCCYDCHCDQQQTINNHIILTLKEFEFSGDHFAFWMEQGSANATTHNKTIKMEITLLFVIVTVCWLLSFPSESKQ